MERPSPNAPKRRWRVAYLRIALAVIAILAAAWMAKDRLLNRTSIDGVVNAPIIQLRAGIDGTIRLANVQTGQIVGSGDELLSIVDERINRSYLTELLGRRESLSLVLQAIDGKIAAFTELRSQMEKRSLTHGDANQARLGEMLKEARFAVARSEAALARANGEHMRGEALVAQGHVTIARMEELRTNRQMAAAELDRSNAYLRRIDGELIAARNGILVGDGQVDSPYSRQRMDEMTLRLIELQGERLVTQANLADIDRRLPVERERVSQAGFQTLRSPSNGVVWNVLVTDASDVTRGTPVLQVADCGRAFVEATLPERGFDLVQPGDRVEVTLGGRDKPVSGIVRSVRGAGAVADRTERAANIQRRTTDEMIVLIDLAPSLLSDGASCHLGRSVSVVFAR